MVVWFKLNQEKIANAYCVRANEPITVCGGSCFLAKSLNEASDGTSEKSLPNHVRLLAWQFVISDTTFGLGQVSNVLTSKQAMYYSFFKPKLHTLGVFHPPNV